MIDSKLIEEIVQQVLARLMEDPRFVAAVNAGYFTPLQQNQVAAPFVNSGLPLHRNQTSSSFVNNGLPLHRNQTSSSFINRGFPLHQNQQTSVYPVKRGNSTINIHHRKVLSEWDILQAHRSGKRVITVAKSVIITPLAKDRASDLSVDIIVE